MGRTRFVADGVRLSFVASHLIVNEVDNISADGSTENGRENDGLSRGYAFFIVDSDERSRGGLETN